MVRRRAILIRCRIRDCKSRCRPPLDRCYGARTTGLRPNYCRHIARCSRQCACAAGRCAAAPARRAQPAAAAVGACASRRSRPSTSGLFFVLLFIAAERLPGGVARGRRRRRADRRAAARLARSGAAPEPGCARTGALGLVGVAALVLGPAASLDAVGVAAAIGCAASMATATVLGRRWGRPPLAIVSLTAWQLVIGGLLVAPFVLAFEGVPPVPTAGNLAGFAVMGVLRHRAGLRALDPRRDGAARLVDAVPGPAQPRGGHGDRMGGARPVALAAAAWRRGARDRRRGRRPAGGSRRTASPRERPRRSPGRRPCALLLSRATIHVVLLDERL